MPESVYSPEVDALLQSDPSGFASSPHDWRDHWIYFLLVDRFDNPSAPPRGADPYNDYQGGTFAGIQRRLPYLKELGVGAIWMSPVQMNPQWFKNYWGGYGIMDLLRIEPRFTSDPARALADPAFADKEFRELVDAVHEQKMYVVLDIVLNHLGDLFNYEGARDSAPWNPNGTYDVYWRDENGTAQGVWTDIEKIQGLSRKEGVWPTEFQHNYFFRRRGSNDPGGDISKGDFDRLKEMVTEFQEPDSNHFPVRKHLIRSYQYLMAKFDLDGFRIDTLQYVESDFARVFGNAMREFAQSIGKKNFFTFGEVWKDDDEARIAQFVGRNTDIRDGLIGVDGAIDFPNRKRLVNVCKGSEPPSVLAEEADRRREALRNNVSSHGDAGAFYVTCLDNHDLNERINYPGYPGQTRLAVACLMTMIGVPCIYYGTEQGLDGHGDRRECVREALWGKPNPFDQGNDFYKLIKELSDLRDRQAALRYGRQYFRPCSGNGADFGYSQFKGGILAYSRILNEAEILVVANCSTTEQTKIHVVVDESLSPDGKSWNILFSTDSSPIAPAKTATHGIYRSVEVTLKPLEAQVLR